MNREERRRFVKEAKQKGIREDVAKAYLALKDAGLNAPVAPKKFEEGDKVTLDVAQIVSRKGYDKLSKSYREFVDTHKGEVLTVHIEKNSLVSLKEYPQWLFWTGELNKVQEEAPPEEQEPTEEQEFAE